MPEKEGENLLCNDALRHAEYYDQQSLHDELYARSRNGEEFTELMPLILSRENILMAYRNIKTNTGSYTAGTDDLTIKDIEWMPPDMVVEKVRYMVTGDSQHDYNPKPVRRKDIPKPNGKTRPLGIPCIWDRLIQQCIKQIMEPICEAKFSDNSYGFRPGRSVENAMAAVYSRIQIGHNCQVVEFDIKGFFDNVDHSKLIRQIWAIGIKDKHLIHIIQRILAAPIRMPDGAVITPDKGTPQGGIISPLLANIVLNELDHWVESQWQENPHVEAHRKLAIREGGRKDKSSGYRWMRKNTNMKEMYIVRYADDFRIFCKTKTQANLVKTAVTQWLEERLKLEVSPEKTRVVNVKRRASEFLGFSIRTKRKGHKQVVQSHMGRKAKERAANTLKEQVKKIQRPGKGRTVADEVRLYNSQVMGIQNYYSIATHVNLDCHEIGRQVNIVLWNRLGQQRGGRLQKTGDELTLKEKQRYGKSKMLRYTPVDHEHTMPIYPIAYVQTRNPMSNRQGTCPYTPEGRELLHDNLRINVKLLTQLMRQPVGTRSIEYADNRISRFSAQRGKCAVTGRAFTCTVEIHCHHKIPVSMNGSDKYENLVLVHEDAHRLIHATEPATIDKYKQRLHLNKGQMEKLNNLRETAGYARIA